jgi:hypothetical protein
VKDCGVVWMVLLCIGVGACGVEPGVGAEDRDDVGVDLGRADAEDLDEGGRCADPLPWYRDADGDGFGDPSHVQWGCSSPPGFVPADHDCRDTDPWIRPGETEICDGVDNNCNGSVDEGCDGVGLGECRELTLLAPEVLFALDRSCAMNDRTNGIRRWETVVAAVVHTMEVHADFSFGGLLYPDRQVFDTCAEGNELSCTQAAELPFSPGSEEAELALRERLTESTFPGSPWEPACPCKANPDCGVAQALAPWSGSDGRRPRAVVLISSGSLSTGCGACGGWDGAAASARALAANGVPTHVVRFGGTRGAGALDALAVAGGRPVRGDRSFHDVRDSQALAGVLDGIAANVGGCSRDLDALPAGARPSLRLAGSDLTQGWSVEGTRLTLDAETCARVMAQGWDQLRVTTGCALD